MFEFIHRNRSKKIGLPPGSMVHIGEKKTEEVKFSLIEYDKDMLNEHELISLEEAFAVKDSPLISWLNISGLHDTGILQNLADHFGIHPLVMEDILNTGHQPKTEIYEDYLFTIIKLITYNKDQGSVEFEQVSIIMGKGYVITFQEKEGDIFEPIRQRLKNPKGRFRRHGSDYLTYTLLDVVVDNYYLILEQLEEHIFKVEENILESPAQNLTTEIQELKMQIIQLRKSVWPLRAAIDGLMDEDSGMIDHSIMPFLKDLYDHTIHVTETIEIFREMISGLMDLYLTMLSNRMNDVMKVLTIIATIFIPLTFIAGIYGMNFEYMPELKWHAGYFIVWGLMITLGIMLLILFRRRKWI
jgi:magnesium transporter